MKPWTVLAPALAAASAAAFSLHRGARTPFAPYGDFGAAHLEHQVRLTAVIDWQATAGEPLWQRIVAVDGQYPPLLHLLTMPVSAWTGYAIEDVAWTGLIWLALLALAVAGCAWAVPRSAAATSAAATLVFLWPVGPAVAERYYYDLPLTAVLWSAAAVALLGWDGLPPGEERPPGPSRVLLRALFGLPPALLVGAIAALSCGFKWTALAFAPILVGAAFVTPVHRRGEPTWSPSRVLALAVATAFGAALLWRAAEGLGPTSSLATTFNDMWPGVGDALYDDGGRLAPGAALAALRSGGGDGVFRPGLVFYPLTLVTALLSPALALALAGPLWHWLRADRRGASFVAVVVAGQYLFLALVISALDERFLLTLVPGVLLAAAIGWSSLDAPRRRRTAAIVIAVSLGVSADFHYGRDLPWSTPIVVPVGEGVVVRGIGLGDSWEQRGWARLDSQTPPRLQARRMLLALSSQCGFGPEAMRDAPSSSSPFGERHWIEYESLLESLGAAPPSVRIDDCGPWISALSGVDVGAVVDRGLLQRAAVELLDGDERTHRVQVRGCVQEAFPEGPPETLRSSRLLTIEQEGPRCLRVFEDRGPA